MPSQIARMHTAALTFACLKPVVVTVDLDLTEQFSIRVTVDFGSIVMTCSFPPQFSMLWMIKLWPPFCEQKWKRRSVNLFANGRSVGRCLHTPKCAGFGTAKGRTVVRLHSGMVTLLLLAFCGSTGKGLPTRPYLYE